MLARGLIALAILVLCPLPARARDDCGLEQAQAMVGTLAPGLKAVSVGRRVRIVRPAPHPPHDTDPRRLNIELDASEVVIRVWCG